MSSKFTIVALALTALTTGAGAGTLQSRGWSVATRAQTLRTSLVDAFPNRTSRLLLWDNRDECNPDKHSSSNINCVKDKEPTQFNAPNATNHNAIAGNVSVSQSGNATNPNATTPEDPNQPSHAIGDVSVSQSGNATNPNATTPEDPNQPRTTPVGWQYQPTTTPVGLQLSQSGGATNYNETISRKSNSQEGAFPSKEVGFGVGAGVLALGGFLYRLCCYSAPPAPQRIIVEGVGVAAPAPAIRVDIVNPRNEVRWPVNMNIQNFQNAPGQGNGR